jgi:Ribonuclease G/E
VTEPTDRDTTETPEGTGTTSEQAPASGRSRTRTRRGGRARGGASRRGESAAAGDGDERTDAAPDADASDSGKRRRRGRRGRGRGRGQARTEASAERETRAADAPADTGGGASSRRGATHDTATAGSGGRGGGGRASGAPADSSTTSRSPGGRAKGAGRAKGTGKDDDAGGADGDARDREVRAAMAKGGTRAAAKRSGSGGNRSGGRRQQRPGGVPEEVRRAILEGPPRTMLVTSQDDRTQIAVLEDRTVVEHYVTRTDDVTLVGNIYMGRVQNVLPGMEAAFLDIGTGRNGVLYAGEVLYDELDLEEGASERIENVLKSGQKVLVQVTKDPMGSKGPRLTMHLSLAGRFMVLAPNSDLFGISRKLTDKERDRLRRLVKAVKPSHHGVIVRTAAEGATEEQVTADIERLLAKWERVEQRAAEAKALSAVYEEPPLVVKVIRDNFGPEFERCIVDAEGLYHQVRDYLGEVAPELLDKVELYGAPTTDALARAAGAPALATPEEIAAATALASGSVQDPSAGGPDQRPEGETADGAGDGAAPPTDGAAGGADDPGGAGTAAADDASTAQPAAGGSGVMAEPDLEAAAERRKQLPALFAAYDVTEQLRKAMGKKVWLPSGGYLIIETTEAMKVIDVNTGKFTGGKDTNLEEVVLKTNLEAADEIVRQLRLRDMGGIIIIDFIDMLLRANQEQVVRRLKRELLRDRTKTRVSDVSQLGLVQMTRKNVSQGLLESFSETCEACGGRGTISEIG